MVRTAYLGEETLSPEEPQQTCPGLRVSTDREAERSDCRGKRELMGLKNSGCRAVMVSLENQARTRSNIFTFYLSCKEKSPQRLCVCGGGGHTHVCTDM